MGPGIVGTDTRLGFSGIEVGTDPRRRDRARTACRSRASRVSFADARPRHHGLSHHTATALRVATPRAGARPGARPSADAAQAARLRPISTTPGSPRATTWSRSTRPTRIELLARHGLRIESMGRPAADDPVLFEAAAAAGALAARYVDLASTPMVDRLERLLNLPATLLDTRRPLTLDEIAERIGPAIPADKACPPASVRARQGDPARAGRADHGGDARRLRLRPGVPHPRPTTTTCPTSGSPTTSPPRSTWRSARSARGDDAREALLKLGGVTGEGADATSPTLPVTPGARRAVRGRPPTRRRHVHVPRRDPAARAVGRRPAARPLVRRRPRPRPRRIARVPRRPHRRRRRDGRRRELHATARHRPGRARAQRPAHLRRGPARRRARCSSTRHAPRGSSTARR